MENSILCRSHNLLCQTLNRNSLSVALDLPDVICQHCIWICQTLSKYSLYVTMAPVEEEKMMTKKPPSDIITELEQLLQVIKISVCTAL